MDRNTVIGLVLIGLILTVFAMFNKPTEDEDKANQDKTEQVDQHASNDEKDKGDKTDKDQADKDKPESAQEKTNTLVGQFNDKGERIVKDGLWLMKDTLSGKDTLIEPIAQEETRPARPEIPEEIIRLENEKLIIDFTTKGGQIAAVYLKEFETYKEFNKKDNKIEPLPFFKHGDGTNGLSFPLGKSTFNSFDQDFKVAEQTDSKIVFSYEDEEGKQLSFSYVLKPKAYDIDYSIRLKGYGKDVTAKNVQFIWKADLRKTERLFSEQRRVSTLCFKYKDEGFSYLSEMADSDLEAEDEVEWVAFKQSYFSSILRPASPFGRKGSEFSIDDYKDHKKKGWSHLKGYDAALNLDLTDVNDAKVDMNWYFGPNDYETLVSYEEGYDDILNYGWGIFRWINLYAVQPLYNALSGWGIGAGLAILLLTLVLKLILMPTQWKMYVSSAKMRILRPEIEEINKKYPDKEDAMKRQMETMSLYRESGASPLAGCLPMLIQMPILLAVFRFFPSTFELRQKSFLWAEDLSSYDSVWDFGVNIWFYGDHMSLFTLLMAGTTLVYTIINSGNMQSQQQPGMPDMRYIMYFFPVMMIFFFNNYASGLSYYYFISTLMSILLMLMIKRFFVDEAKLKAQMAARKANASADGTKKKKSKFQERLEQMQKAQLEQKNKKK